MSSDDWRVPWACSFGFRKQADWKSLFGSGQASRLDWARTGRVGAASRLQARSTATANVSHPVGSRIYILRTRRPTPAQQDSAPEPTYSPEQWYCRTGHSPPLFSSPPYAHLRPNTVSDLSFGLSPAEQTHQTSLYSEA